MGMKKRIDPIFQTRNRLVIKHRGQIIGEVYTLRRSWPGSRRRGRRAK
jgi:hypothetical protein